MLILIALFVLLVVSYIAHSLAAKAEFIVESNNEGKFREHEKFHELQRQFFIVYFLATFSDWLQGPYIYQVYSSYGYSEPQIALLYISGFFSSMLFGTGVGVLADRFGRKRLCVAYSILYAVSCLTKASPKFAILLVGRILGGICTSILFSTFEAWYIYQHVEKYHFPSECINLTLAKATFYNSVLAICAGVVSNIAVEWAEWGPVTPFMIAVPCLLSSAGLTMYMWEENSLSPSNFLSYKCNDMRGICETKNLFKLGLIQSLYESVMYTFVFLWTPVLEPLRPPLGIVFSCFMLCIMIGSSLYSFLIARKYTSEKLLNIALIIACVCFFILVGARELIYTYPQDTGEYSQLAFIIFSLYEISVGMYFPAVGYLRSQIIPEKYRASIANVYRVPMNIFTCMSLFWLKNVAHVGKDYTFDTAFSSHKAFITCSVLLLGALVLSRTLRRDGDTVRVIV